MPAPHRNHLHQQALTNKNINQTVYNKKATIHQIKLYGITATKNQAVIVVVRDSHIESEVFVKEVCG